MKNAYVIGLSSKSEKNHQENPQKGIVQTLDAQAANANKYLGLQRNMRPAHKHAAEKKQQAVQ